ncbi:MAG: hypothetical protein IH908_04545 [Proteobacteria bacterium]|nr:hypothetical protein [Pseudomonadota bacterium]
MAKIFLEHPNAVGETYAGHFRQATRIGASLIAVGAACFVHALFPGLFVRTASDKIRSLAAQIDKRLGTVQAPIPPIENPASDYPLPPLMMSEKPSN